MAAYTEEALSKLSKPELVAITLKMSQRMEALNDSILEEVKQINSNFKLLESDLSITKNANTLLHKRLISMERQCWANAQYSRRECIEVAGIPSSVADGDLKTTVCNIAAKINTKLSSCDIQACHRNGKQGVTIVKFSNRRDCQ